jgi:phosphoglycolate phosphatase-like HAD superfamily hydrolase
MNHLPRLDVDALILTRDDTLIDVSRSYPEVVAKTVQLYLEQGVGLLPSAEPLLTTQEVNLLYQNGNFSSYLDAATALLIYFIELLPPVPSPTFPSRYHVPAIVAYLQMAGGRLHIKVDSLREQKNISGLVQDITAAGGGLNGANAALAKINRHLLVEGGNITRTNLVGRVFQEFYLGSKLFEQIYGQPPVLAQSQGFIARETLLIDRDTLTRLTRRLPLGLVAACSRAELNHTLQTHHLTGLFQSTITLDDMRAARAEPPPAPWSLLEAARCLPVTPAHCAYMGATTPDIQAAKAASHSVPFTAIGVLAGAPDKAVRRRAFEQAGAGIIIGHPLNIQELILD